jgi:UDP-glucose 4-epimerase
MKFLITGVAGLLGSHVSERLVDLGHEVIGIDSLVGGYKKNVPSGVKFFQLDLRSREEIDSCFKNVDIVIHAACTAYEGLSVFSPAFITENTYGITMNCVSASLRHSVKKFVFMSSMARYGSQPITPFTEDMDPRPQDPYGIAKVASEMTIRDLSETHGMQFVILVPHNIIGPRQKYDDPFRNVAAIMINRMLQGKQPIIYGSGNQQRCFSFIDDVVDPILVAAMDEKAIGKTINIGPDEEVISINDLATRIAKLLEFDLSPIYMAERPREVFHATCSADLARRILGYETKVNLDDGLSRMISWIKAEGPRPFRYHIDLEIENELTPKTWIEKVF